VSEGAILSGFTWSEKRRAGHGNLDVDWSRWYRNAVEKSAKQLWGAERHVRAHPDQIFIDPKC
jgi:hypothetical protein